MSEFEKIMAEIQKIHARLDVIEKSTGNMNNHIRFVEKTYDLVRGPLSWLKHKVEYVSGRPQYEELPPIEKDGCVYK